MSHDKIIIVYYSFTKNNETIAKELQTRLKCDIYKIEELKRRFAVTILLDLIFKRRTRIKQPDIQLQKYEIAILVAPIWDSKIATPMKSFIEIEKNNLPQYSFITVCNGREGQAEILTRQLALLAGKLPQSLAELRVNDLLPPEKKNKIRYATPYRIKKPDIETFQLEIENFLASLHINN